MSRKTLSRNIPLYYATEFFSELVFIIPVWVAFQRQYLSFSEMAVIASLRYFTTMVLELPTGALADLLGRKTSIIIGYLFNVVGLIVLGSATAKYPIAVAAVIRAIGESFMSGANTAIIYDSLIELRQEQRFHRVRSMGVMFSQYGLIIAPAIGSVLAGHSLRAPFFASAGSFLAASVAGFLMVEPSIDTEKFTLTSYVRQTRNGFRELFRNSYSQTLTLYYAVAGGISWSWQVFFNIVYLGTLGVPETVQGWVYSGARLTNALIITAFIRNRDFSRTQKILSIPLIMAAVSFLVPVASGFGSFLLLAPLHLPSTLRFIFLDAETNQVFTSRNRATALSALNMLLGFVYILFVTLAGGLLDRYGVHTVYLVSGALTVLVIIPTGMLLLRFRREQR